jgi:hypothetical protein
MQKQQSSTMTTMMMIQGLGRCATTGGGVAGGSELVASGMNLLDRIAYERNGHAKRQHHGYNQANAQSQAELDISQNQSGGCHTIASNHAITLFNLVFRHVTGDDGCNGRDKWYEKPCNNTRYQADDCERAGGLGRGKRGILLIHFCLLLIGFNTMHLVYVPAQF